MFGEFFSGVKGVLHLAFPLAQIAQGLLFKP